MRRARSAGPYRSVALRRFAVDERSAGTLQLKTLRRECLSGKELEFHQGIADILGPAIASQRAQWALGERVKELTCLYGISRIAQLSGVGLDEALQRIVELLPPAWQFPGIACARIQLDRRAFATAGFREGPHRQAADLMIDGKQRGVVEVVYTEERPEFAAGPFLAEERSLIDTIAREVGVMVERREAEEYQSSLQVQLRHADRLATIGQLAAGVAHELNEPLGSILGFAQLIQKYPVLPEGAARDAERIVRGLAACPRGDPETAGILAREEARKGASAPEPDCRGGALLPRIPLREGRYRGDLTPLPGPARDRGGRQPDAPDSRQSDGKQHTGNARKAARSPSIRAPAAPGWCRSASRTRASA